MFDNKFGDSAVSPVVGVILMVAVTVILAAVIGSFVLDLGSNTQANPSAGVTFDEDPTTGDVSVQVISMGNADEVVVNYDGGTENLSSVGDSTMVASAGETVTVTALLDGKESVIQTHNPTYTPPAVFQSVSTTSEFQSGNVNSHTISSGELALDGGYQPYFTEEFSGSDLQTITVGVDSLGGGMYSIELVQLNDDGTTNTLEEYSVSSTGENKLSVTVDTPQASNYSIAVSPSDPDSPPTVSAITVE